MYSQEKVQENGNIMSKMNARLQGIAAALEVATQHQAVVSSVQTSVVRGAAIPEQPINEAFVEAIETRDIEIARLTDKHNNEQQARQDAEIHVQALGLDLAFERATRIPAIYPSRGHMEYAEAYTELNCDPNCLPPAARGLSEKAALVRKFLHILTTQVIGFQSILLGISSNELQHNTTAKQSIEATKDISLTNINGVTDKLLASAAAITKVIYEKRQGQLDDKQKTFIKMELEVILFSLARHYYHQIIRLKNDEEGVERFANYFAKIIETYILEGKRENTISLDLSRLFLNPPPYNWFGLGSLPKDPVATSDGKSWQIPEMQEGLGLYRPYPELKEGEEAQWPALSREWQKLCFSRDFNGGDAYKKYGFRFGVEEEFKSRRQVEQKKQTPITSGLFRLWSTSLTNPHLHDSPTFHPDVTKVTILKPK